MAITPATLSLTEDGTPYAPVYDDVYHSRAGAIAQARHVFLGGNQLPARWAGRDSFVIVETGFGLGLNFLTTWAAWLAQPDDEQCIRLHFVSVEKHPLLKVDLIRLLEPYKSEFASHTIDALIEGWPVLAEGTHRLEFEQGQVVLTLIFGDAEIALPQLAARADAIYLDGFSPAKNPEIWSDRVCQSLYRLAGEGTTLATWSVNGALRRRLNQNGFDLTLAPGFAQKREMLCGRFKERRPHPNPAITPGHALIIGAGLAGTATAERLAARGWRCTILEANTLACGASGNKAGVIRPQPSADDNLLARLTRAGFLSTLSRLERLKLSGNPVDWDACGVLHLAKDDDQETLMQRTVAQLDAPRELLDFVSQARASELADLPLVAGGWWFSKGGWVNPSDYCQQLLKASAATLIENTSAASLTRDAYGWMAHDNKGTLLARGDIVVLANATAIPTIAAPFTDALPIRPARGQTTVYATPPGPAPKTVVCRSGYWTPSIRGESTSGASFLIDDTDLIERCSEHEDNLTMLAGISPEAATALSMTDHSQLHGKVGLRPVVPDRLPLVGQVPNRPSAEPSSLSRAARARVPGLYVNSGYGARGILLASLCAELLASQIAGEPLPLPKDLVRAIDPMRYAHKKIFTEETSNEN
jgi:tRNA 5-methylaminomethyl-2-thiouridine biosynthesis bifunctional protein